MNRLVIWLLFVSLLFSSLLYADESFEFQPLKKTDKYVPGRVVVQFKKYALSNYHKLLEGQNLEVGNQAIDGLNQKYKATRFEQMFPGSEYRTMKESEDMPDFYIIYLDPDTDLNEAIREYGKNPYVVWAGPNYLLPWDAVPNDPLYTSDQYWLNNSTGVGIGAPEVWDYESGSEEIIVGVIDSGVLWNHGDLISNIWQNLGEDFDGDGHTLEGGVFDPGDNGQGGNNDGNVQNHPSFSSFHYTDDLIGFDWVSVAAGNVWPGEDSGPMDNDPTDFSGHGTNIAGLIAASTNNTIGVAGIAGGYANRFPGVKIMCLRTGYLGSDGYGYNMSAESAQAIYYAVTKGADVINLSFGPGRPDPCSDCYGTYGPMITAINHALDNDVVVTKAAGNDTIDCQDYMSCIDGVINVAALDDADEISDFSNFGDWIDISAAGVYTMTTDSDLGVGGYAGYDGTSFSAPIVAGVAALIRSHNPNLNRVEVADILFNTAVDVDGVNPGYEGMLGAGRVNAYDAILSMPTAYFTSTAALTNEFVPHDVDFVEASPAGQTITGYEWDFGDGEYSFDQNPTHTFNTPGIFDVSLTITTADGNDTYTYPKMFFAMGDTVWIDEIYDLSVNDEVDVYFYLKNYETIADIKIPVEFPSGTIDALGLYTDGTRCENFEVVSYDGLSTRKLWIKLKADYDGDGSPSALEPGSGPICYVKFRVDQSGDHAITLYDDWRDYIAFGQYYAYQPAFRSGMVSTSTDALCGDVNNDGTVDISDAVFLINFVFVPGFPSPDPYQVGDVNCNITVDISDAVYLINLVFVPGSPDPCDINNDGSPDC